MEEPDKVWDNEVGDEVREDREEIENEEHRASEFPDAKPTAELNLVIVFLSLLSSQKSEESSTLAKNEEDRQIAKDSIKKLLKARREIDEVKPVRRRTTERFKTTVRDSRHGRRL